MSEIFSIKQLQASITINPTSSTPTFKGSNSNTITFGGSGDAAVKMRAEIHNAGGIDGRLDLAVWGLPLDIMNQLSTFGMQINLIPKNQIILQAGDESGLSQAYVGSIITSMVNPQQPDVSMQIIANAAAAFSAVAGKPVSYNGKVDVATAMASIAQSMGLQFENNGVSAQLSNVYLYGSPRDQYNELRQQADIAATIDRGVLAIWPKFKNRNGQALTISPTDGTLIGYPAYTANGMMFTALYNSSYAIGKQVTVADSELEPANATWNVYGVNHSLESQTEHGKWESELFATSSKFPTPVTNG